MSPVIPSAASGREPQIGGESSAGTHLSGYEPLLGGIRRAGADLERVQALLNAESDAERERILEFVTNLGQAQVYAAELAQVVPARARHKVGNWRGTFTPGQRIRAIAALGLIGSYESVVPLVETLADDISGVRLAAAEALRAICRRFDPDERRTQIATRALIDALRVLPLSGRKVVAGILAEWEPELVLGPLLQTALNADEWWARREAAWVLGTLGDRRATRRLVDTLHDPSTAVRVSAAWALGRLDAPVAVGPLLETSQDADEVVRAAALEALGAQAARLSALDEGLRPALDRITSALDDNDLSVRHAAVEALAGINTLEARRRLQEFLGR